MNYSDFGPFGPVAGYGTAIISVAIFINFTWFGRYRTWLSDSAKLDFEIPRIATLITGVGIVALFLLTTPYTLYWVLGISLVLCVITVMSWTKYRSLVSQHSYKVVRALEGNHYDEVKVLGGDELTPNANLLKNSGQQTNEQDMLEGLEYRLDLVWTRKSLDKIARRVSLSFVSMMVSGTLVLSSLGFIVQVKLTGKPATSVISTDDAPALPKLEVDKLPSDASGFNDK